MTDPTVEILRHYGRRGVFDAALAALQRSGLLDRPLTPQALAPFDQFHTGGHDATIELARLAGVRAGAHVLDIGGGVGGPARALAHSFSCRVTVLDLTPEYCELGVWLTDRCSLSALVAFEVGDARKMRFLPHSFDVVWTQHTTMNLPDKAAFLRSVRNLLVDGGRYAFHEVVAGDGVPHYPTPWADSPQTSWLPGADELRSGLADAGLELREWDDLTGDSLRWLAASRRAGPAAPPSLCSHLLLGEGAAAAFANHARNLGEGRTRVVRGVAVAR